MIGHFRQAHRTQQNGIVLAHLHWAIDGHHFAGTAEPFAAPIVRGPNKSEAKAAAGRFKHLNRRRHNLLADAIARN